MVVETVKDQTLCHCQKNQNISALSQEIVLSFIFYVARMPINYYLKVSILTLYDALITLTKECEASRNHKFN